MVQFGICSGGDGMEMCEVCGKDLDHGYKTLSVYTARLLRRGVSKGKTGSTIASEYGKFSQVAVRVCNRHIRGLWIQRLIPASMAFILVYIPVATLIYLVPVWKPETIPVMFILSAVVTLAIVILLVRRITYEAYVARLLTIQARNHEEKVEFFGNSQYRRIMRNLAKLENVLKENEKD